MSWGFVAAGVGTAVGGYLGSEGAKKAGEISEKGTELSIQEQRRQFDKIQELLAPYVEGGREALNAQRALLGLAGSEEQATAISAIKASPQYEALIDVGEEGILQSASATGGLRGGNIQESLGEFRPRVLSDLIQQQFQRLGGLTTLGQSSAAGVGTAGLQTGANISSLISRGAETQGNVALSRYGTYADLAGNIGGLVGAKFAGGGKF